MSENKAVANPKYSPVLKYKLDELPEQVREKIVGARLMPYVHFNKTRQTWLVGYSYDQSQMITGAGYRQQINKWVADGKIKLVGSIPQRVDSDVMRTLLDIDDVEKMRTEYHPHDEEYDGRAYEVHVIPDEYEAFRQYCRKHKIPVKDLTQQRREYAKRARAKKGGLKSENNLHPD